MLSRAGDRPYPGEGEPFTDGEAWLQIECIAEAETPEDKARALGELVRGLETVRLAEVPSWEG